MYYPYLKRLLDISGAALGLLVCGPFLVIVAVLIQLKMGGPVIFRQVRAGKNRKDFVIYKFRTMSDEVDQDGQPLTNSDRVTALGRILRKTSIDELPQLFNVLKGDMSLIGPRPLMSNYMPFYSEHELKRFDVLPGITGLAQIEGRHNASWDVRLANDVAYVEDISFLLDIKIALRTVAIVLKQSDVVVAPSEDVAHLHVARASNMSSLKLQDIKPQRGFAAVESSFDGSVAVLAKRRA